MRISSTAFLRSIGNTSQIAACPEAPEGEIAVVGRSNVGKSSLINFMVGTSVARTSRTPGRTRLINVFLVNGRFHLIDLPGYGYAGGNARERHGWAPLIETFIHARSSLHGLLLLMDARHFPLTADLAAAEWMEHEDIPYIPVFTKIDKLTQRELSALRKLAARFLAEHPHARNTVFTSAHDGTGKHELLAAVAQLLGS